MLRQQADHGDDRPSRSLADFVAPAESDLTDHLGAFAVTAGIGATSSPGGSRPTTDAICWLDHGEGAGRQVAEGSAEGLHARARREWYESGPAMSNDELIAERYRGTCRVRLPGLPGPQPQGHVLRTPRRVGRRHRPPLYFAMTPAASVSGLYFGHPPPGTSTADRPGPGRGSCRWCGDRREAETGLGRTSRTSRTEIQEPAIPPIRLLR